MSDPIRYIVVEIKGSSEPGDETEPEIGLHPGTIEIYGEWRIVADWRMEPNAVFNPLEDASE